LAGRLAATLNNSLKGRLMDAIYRADGTGTLRLGMAGFLLGKRQ
jgi:hypothetical protein